MRSRASEPGKEGLEKGVHDRFTLTNDQFSIDGCRIRSLGRHLGATALRLLTRVEAEPLPKTGRMCCK